MPLSNQEHLQTLLDRTTVEALFDGMLDAMQPFVDADSLIERYIGTIPTNPPEALRAIAADIVVWSLTGRQQQITQEELERREKRFDAALATLERLRTGEIKLVHPPPPAAPVIAQAGSKELQGDMP